MRFRFPPLGGSMSRCVYLQISGDFILCKSFLVFFFFSIKCCIILWGLMQDFVRKKQYFIPFLYSFYKSTPSPHVFFSFSSSVPQQCSAAFLSDHPIFMYFFPPFIYGRLQQGLFLLRLQHFLLASSSHICAALPFSFYPSSNFLS